MSHCLIYFLDILLYSNQVSCIDVSRERNEQTKNGKCHPGNKGKKGEKVSNENMTSF